MPSFWPSLVSEGCGERAEWPEAIVDRDGDDAGLGVVRSIVAAEMARAEEGRAAIEPHDDRCFRGGRGGIDVEVETVFRLDAGDAAAIGGLLVEVDRLRAGRLEGDSGALARPWRGLLWRGPAEMADRRLGERHTAEHAHAILHFADQRAGVDLHFCGLRAWRVSAARWLSSARKTTRQGSPLLASSYDLSLDAPAMLPAA